MRCVQWFGFWVCGFVSKFGVLVSTFGKGFGLGVVVVFDFNLWFLIGRSMV